MSTSNTGALAVQPWGGVVMPRFMTLTATLVVPILAVGLQVGTGGAPQSLTTWSVVREDIPWAITIWKLLTNSAGATQHPEKFLRAYETFSSQP